MDPLDSTVGGGLRLFCECPYLWFSFLQMVILFVDLYNIKSLAKTLYIRGRIEIGGRVIPILSLSAGLVEKSIPIFILQKLSQMYMKKGHIYVGLGNFYLTKKLIIPKTLTMLKFLSCTKRA